MPEANIIRSASADRFKGTNYRNFLDKRLLLQQIRSYIQAAGIRRQAAGRYLHSAPLVHRLHRFHRIKFPQLVFGFKRMKCLSVCDWSHFHGFVHKYFSVNDYYAVIIVDNSVIVMGPLREKYFRVIRVIRGPCIWNLIVLAGRDEIRFKLCRKSVTRIHTLLWARVSPTF